MWSWIKRLIRIIAITTGLSLTFLLALDLGAAWIYAYFLTHPGCRQPTPIGDLPSPQETWLSTKDQTIRAWYYPSQNGVALLALGGLEGALGDRLPPVGFLVNQGYGILQIDSRACAKPGRAVTLGALEYMDAEAGLAFLQNRPEVNHIGIFGFSMGAVGAIRTASRHSEVEFIIAEGGYHNLGEDFVEPEEDLWLPHRLFLYSIAGAYWIQTGSNPWLVSPIDDLSDMSPRPILLIYGEDEVQSGHAQAQFEAASHPKYIWMVKDSDHGINYQTQPEEYQRQISYFLNNIFP